MLSSFGARGCQHFSDQGTVKIDKIDVQEISHLIDPRIEAACQRFSQTMCNVTHNCDWR